MRTLLLIIFVAAIAPTIAGCGGSDTKKHSAYDEATIVAVQKEIGGALRDMMNDMDIADAHSVVHCNADNDRSFSCTGITTYRNQSGGGTCSDVQSQQRGTVDPESGKYQWQADGAGSTLRSGYYC